jgi:LysR family transcriptional regulator, nitrogen assimilation regulatory protein
MDLKQLRALVTVAETGNVTRASVLLNIVQPAVSRQLRLLEEDMGTTLFERGRQGMELTDAGKTMVEYARRILNEVARAKAEIRPSLAPIGGIVTIGLLASTAHLLTSALVTLVTQEYPGIRLRISVGYAGHLRDWLEKGEVDVALLYDQKQTPALQVKAVLEEPLWIVAPASARLRLNRPLELVNVVGKPFILPSAPHGLRALMEQAANLMGVNFSVHTETNDLYVQKNLVANGHGWTILPAVAVADDVAMRLLSAAPLAEPALMRKIVLAAPTSRQATPPVRCVVAALLECMRTAVQENRWAGARWLDDN